jgi:SARP family transcriptional regulator, regulator of embCAB operon
VVSTDTLSEELWDDRPPRSAATTLQTYVYQIRRILGNLPGSTPECDILTRARGYTLRTPDARVDAGAFCEAVGKGRELWRQERVADATAQLGRALALWRGHPLADVKLGPQLRIHAAHLAEVRLRALELRIQADAKLGRHRELIPELRSLVAEHRLNEWLHAQLIESLSAVGRRAEALQAYHDLRRVLRAELGLEPTSEVKRLQTEILSGARGMPSGLLRRP